ncbi:hypothetical protein ABK040_012018 [Willaertia magna]
MLRNNNQPNFVGSYVHPLQQQNQPTSKQVHLKVYFFENKNVPTGQMKEGESTTIRRTIINVPGFTYNDFVEYVKKSNLVTSTEDLTFRYVDDEGEWCDFSSEEEWNLAHNIFLQASSKKSSDKQILKVAVIIPPKKEEIIPPHCRRWMREGNRGGNRGCPWRQRAFGCPWRQNLEQEAKEEKKQENGILFKRDEKTGEPILEIDLDMDKVQSGLTNVMSYVKENIDNVQYPHYGVVCDGCGHRNFVGKRWKCKNCYDFDFCDKCFNSEKKVNHCGGVHSFEEREPRGMGILHDLIHQRQPQQQQVEEKKKEEQQVVKKEEPKKEEVKKVEEVKKQEEQKKEEKKVEVPKIQPIVKEEKKEEKNQAPVFSQPQQPVVTQPTFPNIQFPFPQQFVVPPQHFVVPPQPIVQQQPPVVTQPIQQPVVNHPVHQPAPQIKPFAKELVLLKEMGFFDENKAIQLLQKHNGDVQRVVVDLLNDY